jgi:hypothetical protein
MALRAKRPNKSGHPPISVSQETGPGGYTRLTRPSDIPNTPVARGEVGYSKGGKVRKVGKKR